MFILGQITPMSINTPLRKALQRRENINSTEGLDERDEWLQRCNSAKSVGSRVRGERNNQEERRPPTIEARSVFPSWLTAPELSQALKRSAVR